MKNGDKYSIKKNIASSREKAETIPFYANWDNQKVAKRNFLLGVTNGILFNISESLLDPALVLVAFLSHLTQSPFLLGLVVPIRDGAWWLPQLWVSSFLQNKPHKILIYQKTSIFRIAAWLCIALSINLVHNPSIILPLFFVIYLISAVSNGIAGLPFLEVVAKTIPPEKRGEYFAWRLGLGGLGGVGASFLVRYVLDPGSPLIFPYNFGFLAIFYFIGASISLLIFNKVEEKKDVDVLPRFSLKSQIVNGIKITKNDSHYRYYMLLQATMIGSGAAIPFFAVYVQRAFGVALEMIGIYLLVLSITNLVSNFILGRISRTLGYRKVMLIAAISGLLMLSMVIFLSFLSNLVVISPAFASAWLIPVFIFSSFRSTGIGVAGNSLLIELAPETGRSLYLGFTNTILGFVLLSTGILGFFIEIFGFQFIFVICAIFTIVAIFSTFQLIRSQR